MLKVILNKFKLFYQTSKATLCLMVASSTLLGYFLATPYFTSQGLYSFLGVFFLACGAASFNSVQEKDADAAYQRTSKRPVASGRVSKKQATLLATTLCTAGLALLGFAGNNLLPLLLGVLALIIYNLIYTPLKAQTEFALIPGGISGALPPYIGWVSGGGPPLHPLIWAVMALFFLWQPPHFCLILLQYAEDYRSKKKFQNFITKFSKQRVKRLIAVWLLAVLSIVLLLAAIPGILSETTRILLVGGAPVFIALFLIHLFMSRQPRYKILFISLNGFMASVMALLTFSSISSIL